jgi:aarF domain-containing kinase
MEVEAKRQLEMLGIDTSGGIAQVIRNAAKNAADNPNNASSGELVRRVTNNRKSGNDEDKDKSHKRHRNAQFSSWNLSTSKVLGRFLSVDSILWTIRIMKRMYLLSQAALVKSLDVVPNGWISGGLQEWKETHETAALQAHRLGQIESWCTALFDVHGHQVFNLGLFNADPHPGNILLVEVESNKTAGKKGGRKQMEEPMVGLIDYGQCKKLTPTEQGKVARLILSVANEESDELIAQSFRDLKIVTKNDSTEFLAKFGRLMFGSFQPEHMSHDWHQSLHSMDRVLYFPKELSMVYRTALLLRGLAISLQLNYSIGQQWKIHAKEALDRIETST